jgi:hypothetical protein
MSFNIKIKMNSANKIIKDHGLDKDGSVNAFLRDEVERLSDPYVPFQSGFLKNNTTHPSNHEIRYTAPYAHYMYKGKKAVGPSRPKGVKRTISNQPLNYQGAPKRGAEWDKRMMRDKGKQVAKDVEKYIKNGGK